LILPMPHLGRPPPPRTDAARWREGCHFAVLGGNVGPPATA
jgi:hypothetical protein